MYKNEIILGIDPGTQVMGYGVILIKNGQPILQEMDVLKMHSKEDVYVRLEKIHTKVTAVIKEFKPTTFAIEAPFFGKNVQSMLKLGRAQGVAIAAAMQANLLVTEYSPKKVKQSVTGNGNADKEQVWKMIQRILNIEEQPAFFDATDALAVALCHFYQSNSPLAKLSKGVKGWDAFVAQHPDKIRGTTK